ncbi:major facilitator superfamily domain-containing protein [Dactylonectria macrodidyma]|uniref:Major facilitator superfamily domain-containing protein n=1 Tax=Dactylonectria macrodidyma TaxID=307937 RepID=A0A9P9ISP4_9HYPO|nr:major facilitator superfamily domain-containing protein [Dactylonectria macrodidyma]
MSDKNSMSRTEHVEIMPGQPKVHLKTLLLLLSVNLIYFAQLVNVVGSGALTRDITAVIGGSSDAVWFTHVISILTAVLGIPVSQAADLWGRKVFLVGLTAFGCVGSIIVSRCNDIGTAIAGFTITGISYGAQPLLLAVTSEVLARKYRPWAQASINVASALGAITGLLVGGALTRNYNHIGFRAYWYMVAAIYAFTAITCQLLYNPVPRALQTQLALKEKLRMLDWVGYAILAPALSLFCMALAWSQNPYSWTDAHVLAPFTIGIVLTVTLVVYEIYGRRDGMFHHDLFRHRNFALSLGCIFVEGLVFFCANNYFAFEVSVLFSTDSLMTGLQYAVAFMSFAVFAVAAGFWCSRNRIVRIPSVVAFAFFTLFNILMATVSHSTSKGQIWGFPVFLGAGLGSCLTALVTAAHFATPPELIAITSGLLISIRSLGGSVGLAMYNAIFSSTLGSYLEPEIAKVVIPLGFPADGLHQLIPALVNHDAQTLASIPDITPEITEAGYEGLQMAYLFSFRYVWVTAGCLSFVAIVACFFLEDPTSEFNSHIDAPAELEKPEKSEVSV